MCGWKLSPKIITCEFEKALMKAVQEEFQRDNLPMKASEFHWEQCSRQNFGIRSYAVF